MKFGVIMFCNEASIDPAALGQAVEERGFESLFLPEHSHIPVSRATAYPGQGEMREEYLRLYDPFVALATVAAVTSRIRLGTGICLVVERDPIHLAKEVSTLDQLSGGRVLLGVGGGWNAEEMANHGSDFRRRFQILRERVEAMKAIWTQDEAEYHGDTVQFGPIWQWPKPRQSPHPPILLGERGGARTFQRVLRFGTGWLPIVDRDPGVFRERLMQFDAAVNTAGREPMPVTCFGVPPRAEALAEYSQMRVERCLLWMKPAPAPEALHQLDQFEALTRPYRDP